MQIPSQQNGLKPQALKALDMNVAKRSQKQEDLPEIPAILRDYYLSLPPKSGPVE
jgi:hypothetical protein